MRLAEGRVRHARRLQHVAGRVGRDEHDVVLRRGRPALYLAGRESQRGAEAQGQAGAVPEERAAALHAEELAEVVGGRAGGRALQHHHVALLRNPRVAPGGEPVYEPHRAPGGGAQRDPAQPRRQDAEGVLLRPLEQRVPQGGEGDGPRGRAGREDDLLRHPVLAHAHVLGAEARVVVGRDEGAELGPRRHRAGEVEGDLHVVVLDGARRVRGGLDDQGRHRHAGPLVVQYAHAPAARLAGRLAAYLVEALEAAVRVQRLEEEVEAPLGRERAVVARPAQADGARQVLLGAQPGGEGQAREGGAVGVAPRLDDLAAALGGARAQQVGPPRLPRHQQGEVAVRAVGGVGRARQRHGGEQEVRVARRHARERQHEVYRVVALGHRDLLAGRGGRGQALAARRRDGEARLVAVGVAYHHRHRVGAEGALVEQRRRVVGQAAALRGQHAPAEGRRVGGQREAHYQVLVVLDLAVGDRRHRAQRGLRVALAEGGAQARARRRRRRVVGGARVGGHEGEVHRRRALLVARGEGRHRLAGRARGRLGRQRVGQPPVARAEGDPLERAGLPHGGLRYVDQQRLGVGEARRVLQGRAEERGRQRRAGLALLYHHGAPERGRQDVVPVGGVLAQRYQRGEVAAVEGVAQPRGAAYAEADAQGLLARLERVAAQDEGVDAPAAPHDPRHAVVAGQRLQPVVEGGGEADRLGAAVPGQGDGREVEAVVGVRNRPHPMHEVAADAARVEEAQVAARRRRALGDREVEVDRRRVVGDLGVERQRRHAERDAEGEGLRPLAVDHERLDALGLLEPHERQRGGPGLLDREVEGARGAGHRPGDGVEPLDAGRGLRVRDVRLEGEGVGLVEVGVEAHRQQQGRRQLGRAELDDVAPGEHADGGLPLLALAEAEALARARDGDAHDLVRRRGARQRERHRRALAALDGLVDEGLAVLGQHQQLGRRRRLEVDRQRRRHVVRARPEGLVARPVDLARRVGGLRRGRRGRRRRAARRGDAEGARRHLLRARVEVAREHAERVVLGVVGGVAQHRALRLPARGGGRARGQRLDRRRRGPLEVAVRGRRRRAALRAVAQREAVRGRAELGGLYLLAARVDDAEELGHPARLGPRGRARDARRRVGARDHPRAERRVVDAPVRGDVVAQHVAAARRAGPRALPALARLARLDAEGYRLRRVLEQAVVLDLEDDRPLGLARGYHYHLAQRVQVGRPDGRRRLARDHAQRVVVLVVGRGDRAQHRDDGHARRRRGAARRRRPHRYAVAAEVADAVAVAVLVEVAAVAAAQGLQLDADVLRPGAEVELRGPGLGEGLGLVARLAHRARDVVEEAARPVLPRHPVGGRDAEGVQVAGLGVGPDRVAQAHRRRVRRELHRVLVGRRAARGREHLQRRAGRAEVARDGEARRLPRARLEAHLIVDDLARRDRDVVAGHAPVEVGDQRVAVRVLLAAYVVGAARGLGRIRHHHLQLGGAADAPQGEGRLEGGPRGVAQRYVDRARGVVRRAHAQARVAVPVGVVRRRLGVGRRRYAQGARLGVEGAVGGQHAVVEDADEAYLREPVVGQLHVARGHDHRDRLEVGRLADALPDRRLHRLPLLRVVGEEVEVAPERRAVVRRARLDDYLDPHRPVGAVAVAAAGRAADVEEFRQRHVDGGAGRALEHMGGRHRAPHGRPLHPVAYLEGRDGGVPLRQQNLGAELVAIRVLRARQAEGRGLLVGLEQIVGVGVEGRVHGLPAVECARRRGRRGVEGYAHGRLAGRPAEVVGGEAHVAPREDGRRQQNQAVRVRRILHLGLEVEGPRGVSIAVGRGKARLPLFYASARVGHGGRARCPPRHGLEARDPDDIDVAVVAHPDEEGPLRLVAGRDREGEELTFQVLGAHRVVVVRLERGQVYLGPRLARRDLAGLRGQRRLPVGEVGDGEGRGRARVAVGGRRVRNRQLEHHRQRALDAGRRVGVEDLPLGRRVGEGRRPRLVQGLEVDREEGPLLYRRVAHARALHHRLRRVDREPHRLVVEHRHEGRRRHPRQPRGGLRRPPEDQVERLLPLEQQVGRHRDGQRELGLARRHLDVHARVPVAVAVGEQRRGGEEHIHARGVGRGPRRLLRLPDGRRRGEGRAGGDAGVDARGVAERRLEDEGAGQGLGDLHLQPHHRARLAALRERGLEDRRLRRLQRRQHRRPRLDADRYRILVRLYRDAGVPYRRDDGRREGLGRLALRVGGRALAVDAQARRAHGEGRGALGEGGARREAPVEVGVDRAAAALPVREQNREHDVALRLRVGVEEEPYRVALAHGRRLGVARDEHRVLVGDDELEHVVPQAYVAGGGPVEAERQGQALVALVERVAAYLHAHGLGLGVVGGEFALDDGDIASAPVLCRSALELRVDADGRAARLGREHRLPLHRRCAPRRRNLGHDDQRRVARLLGLGEFGRVQGVAVPVDQAGREGEPPLRPSEHRYGLRRVVHGDGAGGDGHVRLVGIDQRDREGALGGGCRVVVIDGGERQVDDGRALGDRASVLLEEGGGEARVGVRPLRELVGEDDIPLQRARLAAVRYADPHHGPRGRALLVLVGGRDYAQHHGVVVDDGRVPPVGGGRVHLQPLPAPRAGAGEREGQAHHLGALEGVVALYQHRHEGAQLARRHRARHHAHVVLHPRGRDRYALRLYRLRVPGHRRGLARMVDDAGGVGGVDRVARSPLVIGQLAQGQLEVHPLRAPAAQLDGHEEHAGRVLLAYLRELADGEHRRRVLQRVGYRVGHFERGRLRRRDRQHERLVVLVYRVGGLALAVGERARQRQRARGLPRRYRHRARVDEGRRREVARRGRADRRGRHGDADGYVVLGHQRRLRVGRGLRVDEGEGYRARLALPHDGRRLAPLDDYLALLVVRQRDRPHRGALEQRDPRLAVVQGQRQGEPLVALEDVVAPDDQRHLDARLAYRNAARGDGAGRGAPDLDDVRVRYGGAGLGVVGRQAAELDVAAPPDLGGGRAELRRHRQREADRRALRHREVDGHDQVVFDRRAHPRARDGHRADLIGVGLRQVADGADAQVGLLDDGDLLLVVGDGHPAVGRQARVDQPHDEGLVRVPHPVGQRLGKLYEHAVLPLPLAQHRGAPMRECRHAAQVARADAADAGVRRDVYLVRELYVGPQAAGRVPAPVEVEADRHEGRAALVDARRGEGARCSERVDRQPYRVGVLEDELLRSLYLEVGVRHRLGLVRRAHDDEELLVLLVDVVLQRDQLAEGAAGSARAHRADVGGAAVLAAGARELDVARVGGDVAQGEGEGRVRRARRLHQQVYREELVDFHLDEPAFDARVYREQRVRAAERVAPLLAVEGHPARGAAARRHYADEQGLGPAPRRRGRNLYHRAALVRRQRPLLRARPDRDRLGVGHRHARTEVDQGELIEVGVADGRELGAVRRAHPPLHAHIGLRVDRGRGAPLRARRLRHDAYRVVARAEDRPRPPVHEVVVVEAEVQRVRVHYRQRVLVALRAVVEVRLRLRPQPGVRVGAVRHAHPSRRGVARLQQYPDHLVRLVYVVGPDDYPDLGLRLARLDYAGRHRPVLAHLHLRGELGVEDRVRRLARIDTLRGGGGRADGQLERVVGQIVPVDADLYRALGVRLALVGGRREAARRYVEDGLLGHVVVGDGDGRRVQHLDGRARCAGERVVGAARALVVVAPHAHRDELQGYPIRLRLRLGVVQHQHRERQRLLPLREPQAHERILVAAAVRDGLRGQPGEPILGAGRGVAADPQEQVQAVRPPVVEIHGQLRARRVAPAGLGEAEGLRGEVGVQARVRLPYRQRELAVGLPYARLAAALEGAPHAPGAGRRDRGYPHDRALDALYQPLAVGQIGALVHGRYRDGGRRLALVYRGRARAEHARREVLGVGGLRHALVVAGLPRDGVGHGQPAARGVHRLARAPGVVRVGGQQQVDVEADPLRQDGGARPAGGGDGHHDGRQVDVVEYQHLGGFAVRVLVDEGLAVVAGGHRARQLYRQHQRPVGPQLAVGGRGLQREGALQHPRRDRPRDGGVAAGLAGRVRERGRDREVEGLGHRAAELEAAGYRLALVELGHDGRAPLPLLRPGRRLPAAAHEDGEQRALLRLRVVYRYLVAVALVVVVAQARADGRRIEDAHAPVLLDRLEAHDEQILPLALRLVGRDAGQGYVDLGVPRGYLALHLPDLARRVVEVRGGHEVGGGGAPRRLDRDYERHVGPERGSRVVLVVLRVVGDRDRGHAPLGHALRGHAHCGRHLIGLLPRRLVGREYAQPHRVGVGDGEGGRRVRHHAVGEHLPGLRPQREGEGLVVLVDGVRRHLEHYALVARGRGEVGPQPAVREDGAVAAGNGSGVDERRVRGRSRAGRQGHPVGHLDGLGRREAHVDGDANVARAQAVADRLGQIDPVADLERHVVRLQHREGPLRRVHAHAVLRRGRQRQQEVRVRPARDLGRGEGHAHGVEARRDDGDAPQREGQPPYPEVGGHHAPLVPGAVDAVGHARGGLQDAGGAVGAVQLDVEVGRRPALEPQRVVRVLAEAHRVAVGDGQHARRVGVEHDPGREGDARARARRLPQRHPYRLRPLEGDVGAHDHRHRDRGRPPRHRRVDRRARGAVHHEAHVVGDVVVVGEVARPRRQRQRERHREVAARLLERDHEVEVRVPRLALRQRRQRPEGELVALLLLGVVVVQYHPKRGGVRVPRVALRYRNRGGEGGLPAAVLPVRGYARRVEYLERQHVEVDVPVVQRPNVEARRVLPLLYDERHEVEDPALGPHRDRPRQPFVVPRLRGVARGVGHHLEEHPHVPGGRDRRPDLHPLGGALLGDGDVRQREAQQAAVVGLRDRREERGAAGRLQPGLALALEILAYARHRDARVLDALDAHVRGRGPHVLVHRLERHRDERAPLGDGRRPRPGLGREVVALRGQTRVRIGDDRVGHHDVVVGHRERRRRPRGGEVAPAVLGREVEVQLATAFALVERHRRGAVRGRRHDVDRPAHVVQHDDVDLPLAGADAHAVGNRIGLYRRRQRENPVVGQLAVGGGRAPAPQNEGLRGRRLAVGCAPRGYVDIDGGGVAGAGRAARRDRDREGLVVGYGGADGDVDIALDGGARALGDDVLVDRERDDDAVGADRLAHLIDARPSRRDPRRRSAYVADHDLEAVLVDGDREELGALARRVGFDRARAGYVFAVRERFHLGGPRYDDAVVPGADGRRVGRVLVEDVLGEVRRLRVVRLVVAVARGRGVLEAQRALDPAGAGYLEAERQRGALGERGGGAGALHHHYLLVVRDVARRRRAALRLDRAVGDHDVVGRVRAPRDPQDVALVALVHVVGRHDDGHLDARPPRRDGALDPAHPRGAVAAQQMHVAARVGADVRRQVPGPALEREHEGHILRHRPAERDRHAAAEGPRARLAQHRQRVRRHEEHRVPERGRLVPYRDAGARVAVQRDAVVALRAQPYPEDLDLLLVVVLQHLGHRDMAQRRARRAVVVRGRHGEAIARPDADLPGREVAELRALQFGPPLEGHIRLDDRRRGVGREPHREDRRLPLVHAGGRSAALRPRGQDGERHLVLVLDEVLALGHARELERAGRRRVARRQRELEREALAQGLERVVAREHDRHAHAPARRREHALHHGAVRLDRGDLGVVGGRRRGHIDVAALAGAGVHRRLVRARPRERQHEGHGPGVSALELHLYRQVRLVRVGLLQRGGVGAALLQLAEEQLRVRGRRRRLLVDDGEGVRRVVHRGARQPRVQQLHREGLAGVGGRVGQHRRQLDDERQAPGNQGRGLVAREAGRQVLPGPLHRRAERDPVRHLHLAPQVGGAAPVLAGAVDGDAELRLLALEHLVRVAGYLEPQRVAVAYRDAPPTVADDLRGGGGEEEHEGLVALVEGVPLHRYRRLADGGGVRRYHPGRVRDRHVGAARVRLQQHARGLRGALGAVPAAGAHRVGRGVGAVRDADVVVHPPVVRPGRAHIHRVGLVAELALVEQAVLEGEVGRGRRGQGERLRIDDRDARIQGAPGVGQRQQELHLAALRARPRKRHRGVAHAVGGHLEGARERQGDEPPVHPLEVGRRYPGRDAAPAALYPIAEGQRNMRLGRRRIVRVYPNGEGVLPAAREVARDRLQRDGVGVGDGVAAPIRAAHAHLPAAAQRAAREGQREALGRLVGGVRRDDHRRHHRRRGGGVGGDRPHEGGGVGALEVDVPPGDGVVPDRRGRVAVRRQGQREGQRLLLHRRRGYLDGELPVRGAGAVVRLGERDGEGVGGELHRRRIDDREFHGVAVECGAGRVGAHQRDTEPLVLQVGVEQGGRQILQVDGRIARAERPPVGRAAVGAEADGIGGDVAAQRGHRVAEVDGRLDGLGDAGRSQAHLEGGRAALGHRALGVGVEDAYRRHIRGLVVDRYLDGIHRRHPHRLSAHVRYGQGQGEGLRPLEYRPARAVVVQDHQRGRRNGRRARFHGDPRVVAVRRAFEGVAVAGGDSEFNPSGGEAHVVVVQVGGVLRPRIRDPRRAIPRRREHHGEAAGVRHIAGERQGYGDGRGAVALRPSGGADGPEGDLDGVGVQPRPNGVAVARGARYAVACVVGHDDREGLVRRVRVVRDAHGAAAVPRLDPHRLVVRIHRRGVGAGERPRGREVVRGGGGRGAPGLEAVGEVYRRLRRGRPAAARVEHEGEGQLIPLVERAAYVAVGRVGRPYHGGVVVGYLQHARRLAPMRVGGGGGQARGRRRHRDGHELLARLVDVVADDGQHNRRFALPGEHPPAHGLPAEERIGLEARVRRHLRRVARRPVIQRGGGALHIEAEGHRRPVGRHGEGVAILVGQIHHHRHVGVGVGLRLVRDGRDGYERPVGVIHGVHHPPRRVVVLYGYEYLRPDHHRLRPTRYCPRLDRGFVVVQPRILRLGLGDEGVLRGEPKHQHPAFAVVVFGGAQDDVAPANVGEGVGLPGPEDHRYQPFAPSAPRRVPIAIRPVFGEARQPGDVAELGGGNRVRDAEEIEGRIARGRVRQVELQIRAARRALRERQVDRVGGGVQVPNADLRVRYGLANFNEQRAGLSRGHALSSHLHKSGAQARRAAATRVGLREGASFPRGVHKDAKGLVALEHIAAGRLVGGGQHAAPPLGDESPKGGEEDGVLVSAEAADDVRFGGQKRPGQRLARPPEHAHAVGDLLQGARYVFLVGREDDLEVARGAALVDGEHLPVDRVAAARALHHRDGVDGARHIVEHPRREGSALVHALGVGAHRAALVVHPRRVSVQARGEGYQHVIL